jgi:alkanesulfonate monooxygenase SsuD/methylene tetrahydromethanopterin reductase-like flavin-dependent oxidoreductase (luciferase family)
MPVLGGSFEGYADTAMHYRAIWVESGRKQEDAKIAIFSHLHITETSQETGQDFYPYYSAYLRPMLRGPMSPAVYAQMLSPHGTLVGGSVQQVIDKISMLKEATGANRFVGQIDIGVQRYSAVANGIELLATKVAAAVA